MKRSGPPARRSPLKRSGALSGGGPLRRYSKKSPVKALDKLLHQVVKARDGKCMLAAAGLGKCGGHLQVSHIYPKGRYQAMRYRLENVLLSCWRHHENSSPDSWHSNPMIYAAWFNRAYPQLAQKLALMARVPGKVDRKLDRLYLEAIAAKQLHKLLTPDGKMS